VIISNVVKFSNFTLLVFKRRLFFKHRVAMYKGFQSVTVNFGATMHDGECTQLDVAP
jgi:hypothetical protein